MVKKQQNTRSILFALSVRSISGKGGRLLEAGRLFSGYVPNQINMVISRIILEGYQGAYYLRAAGSICPNLGTFNNFDKNQHRDYLTTEPIRLAGIPESRCRDTSSSVGNFPCKHKS